MGAILSGFWLLLAGSVGAAPVSSAPQESSTNAEKEDSAEAAADSTEKTAGIKSVRRGDPGDLQLAYTAGPRHGFKGLTWDFLGDQKEIWTSPAHLRFSDSQWLVPLSGLTAGLFVTDRDFSKHLSQIPIGDKE